MCFGCSNEPSNGDGSFEYPKHMFWLRNKKYNFQLRTLIWGHGLVTSLEPNHQDVLIQRCLSSYKVVQSTEVFGTKAFISSRQ